MLRQEVTKLSKEAPNTDEGKRVIQQLAERKRCLQGSERALVVKLTWLQNRIIDRKNFSNFYSNLGYYLLKMKVNVKILRGAECTLDVHPDLQVGEFKKLVESNLNIPVKEQKLLLKGKLLLDWKKLSDYDIKDDCKLNLVALDKEHLTPQTSKSPKKDVLQIEMTKFLRRYFSDSDAKKIVDEYMKEFYRATSACNLEDWERIATGYLEEDRAKSKS